MTPLTPRFHRRFGFVLALLMSSIGFLALAQPALALTRSQNVALVPSATGKFNFGGTLPTAIAGQPGVPAGYSPTFANVSPDAIANGSIANPITGFDTVVLVGLCDIGNYLADADFKTRIEAFVSAGGKLVIWDSECTSTNYSNFVYPFTTSNPGAAGATGTLTDVEENSLSSSIPTDPEYVNVAAVASQTDAVGDANVFVSFNQNWCTDLRATNVLGVNGPVQTYARLGSGLIVYDGLDKDFMSNSNPSFDPASASGTVHLQRIWLLQLLQPFNPDNLPCGVKVFGLSLSPKTATNPAGTSHTVTAHVTTNASPTPGVMVTFTVTAGPNMGQTGMGTTDVNGDATFTYTSNGTAGVDTIRADATLIGTGGVPTPVSDVAEKTWTGPGPPASVTLDPPAATNPAGAEHCVTATVLDAQGQPVPNVSVVFSVTGANSASGTVTTDANGQATFCYTGTIAGQDVITAFADFNPTNGTQDPGEPSGTATKTYIPAAPATLTLDPKTATNPVDSEHCVTATVKDAFGNPTPNITVRFQITGSVNTSGSVTTDANGQATFCYTGPALPGSDVITAYADADDDGVQDVGEPGDTASKQWVLPASTAGCKVTYGGRITAANGDKATFGGNAKADGLTGQEEYQDHGPAADINVHSIDVLSVVCSSDGTQASIFGTATINGSGTFNYRIDLKDLGEPGSSDTYRIRLSNGYDSGELVLKQGNVQIH